MNVKKSVTFLLVSLVFSFVFCGVHAQGTTLLMNRFDPDVDDEDMSEILTTPLDAKPDEETYEVLEMASNPTANENKDETFSITKFGAVANGKTDSAEAFMQAWTKACATNEGILDVPQGSFFLSGAMFKGPCNGKTTFRMKGTLVASSTPNKNQHSWIEFEGITGLTVLGGGTFDGNGEASWKEKLNNCYTMASCELPYSVTFTKVVDVHVQDITSKNSKMFHLDIQSSKDVVIDHVFIEAPEDSPNMDGIHIGLSNNVTITNSHIATGDDCISMLYGTTNVNIDSVRCGPGHGISIGSLGKYKNEKDVAKISVSNSNFTNTNNGLRIKTWVPSDVQTTVSDITYSNITFNNVRNPIIIDQHYCFHDKSCSGKGESEIKIKQVKFMNIHGTSSQPIGVVLDCSKSAPCEDIEFGGIQLIVKGTNKRAKAICSNANTKAIGNTQNDDPCKNSGAPKF